MEEIKQIQKVVAERSHEVKLLAKEAGVTDELLLKNRAKHPSIVKDLSRSRSALSAVMADVEQRCREIESRAQRVTADVKKVWGRDSEAAEEQRARSRSLSRSGSPNLTRSPGLLVQQLSSSVGSAGADIRHSAGSKQLKFMVRTMKRRMKVLHSHFPDCVFVDRPVQTDAPCMEVGLQTGRCWNTVMLDKSDQTPSLLPGTKVSSLVVDELLPAGFNPRLQSSELLQALKLAFGETSGTKDCTGTLNVRSFIESLEDLWRLCKRHCPLLARTPVLFRKEESLLAHRRNLTAQIQALATQTDAASEQIKQDKQSQIEALDLKLRPLRPRCLFATDSRKRVTALVKRRLRSYGHASAQKGALFSNFCEFLGLRPWHQMLPCQNSEQILASAAQTSRQHQHQRDLARSMVEKTANANKRESLSLGLLDLEGVRLLDPPAALHSNLSARAAALNAPLAPTQLTVPLHQAVADVGGPPLQQHGHHPSPQQTQPGPGVGASPPQRSPQQTQPGPGVGASPPGAHSPNGASSFSSVLDRQSVTASDWEASLVQQTTEMTRLRQQLVNLNVSQPSGNAPSAHQDAALNLEKKLSEQEQELLSLKRRLGLGS